MLRHFNGIIRNGGYTWSGPILTFTGIIFLGVFILLHPPADDLVSAWLLWSFLSISLVLPLIALGIGLASLDIRLIFVGVLVFLIGFLGGLIYYDKVWIYFTGSPNSLQHLYLTLPLSSLCIGFLLVVPKKIAKWFVLPIAVIVGAMTAITVKLTDPTLHDPLIPRLGVSVSIWILLSISLTTRSFYRSWFPIPIRILGSWLLASGILYGGTSLAIKYGMIKPKNVSTQVPKKEPISDGNLLIPDFTPSDSDGISDK